MMIDVTRVGKVLSRKIRGLSRDMRIVVDGGGFGGSGFEFG